MSPSHHSRQPSLLRHPLLHAHTYMQESCACSDLARQNCRRLDTVIADVVANVHPSTAIYACGHPYSACQRRPAQHRGELMCFGIPQSEGIGLITGLPCCDHARLGHFLRFARAVRHAAQSDARLPESSTADVVSGANVIVLLNSDSVAQAAVRRCRTCCATKHRVRTARSCCRCSNRFCCAVTTAHSEFNSEREPLMISRTKAPRKSPHFFIRGPMRKHNSCSSFHSSFSTHFARVLKASLFLCITSAQYSAACYSSCPFASPVSPLPSPVP